MNIIERAEKVSEALAYYKQLEKAQHELHRLKSGRVSLALSYLELDEHNIERAEERLDKDKDSAYTTLAYTLKD